MHAVNGNSSCGIIGQLTSQYQRLILEEDRKVGSKTRIFDVDHDIKKIYNKIKYIISIQNDFKKKFKCKKIYGDGKAGTKSIKAILKFLKRKDKLKRFN